MQVRTTVALGIFATFMLSACGGSGGGGAATPPPGNPPQANLPPAVFKNLTGTAPADAALGQPLGVEWTLPAGVSIKSVDLEARVVAGPTDSPTSCSVNAGPLTASTTAASITIPGTCLSKTVKQVQLRLSVTSTAGQSSVATHWFSTPGSPDAFLPQRVNLPVLKVTTENDAAIVSKDEYLAGEMTLESNLPGEAAVTTTIQIRGRGNSTWGMPKKPYRLKLDVKQPLLGMPSSRDWVLLANYSDKTLLRNALAMDLGTGMGMPWAPRGRFVELYHGGRYLGVYQLLENIKIAQDRVAIDELDEDDVDADTVSGGYLLEVDFREDGHTIYTAIDQLPVVFQDPEEPAPQQEAFISNFLDEFESVLYSDEFADPATGYAAYIDVDSFVRWFIVNEVFRNRDANMWTSCWMYKPRGGRLHMGPLWDFDIAAGNIDYDDAYRTDGWWIHDAPWFSRLFEDPVFQARVKEIWNDVKATQLPAMMQAIDTRAAELQQAQLNNFQRWPILETYVWPNNQIPGSYAGEISYLRSWLTARIAWMDSQIDP